MISLGLPPFAQAQQAPTAGDIQRQVEQDTRTPTVTPPPPAAVPQTPVDAAGPQVVIREVEIEGASLIPVAELIQRLQPYLNRPMSMGELYAAAQTLVGHYRERGWFARVQVPEQDVSAGTLRIRIVEGRFGRIEVQPGASRANTEYVTNVVGHGLEAGQPYSLAALERGLLLANDLPGVRADGTLRAGSAPGTSDLALQVNDTPLLSGSVAASNYGNRFTGRAQASGSLALNNPSGYGDRLQLFGLVAERLDYQSLDYSLPIGYDGLRGNLGYGQLHYRLGKEFADLDSKGQSRALRAGLDYPLRRSTQGDLRLGLDLARTRQEDESLDITLRRRTLTTASLQLQGVARDDWGGGGLTSGRLFLTQGQADLRLTADRAQDASGAGIDGRFTYLGLDLRRDQVLAPAVYLRGRLAGQLGLDNMDASQQFSLGGAYGVRAYRLVFNHAKGVWVVASETAKARGKSASAVLARAEGAGGAVPPCLALLAGLGLLALPSLSFALDANAVPSGGQVIAGQARIGQRGSQMTIDQGSQRAVIDWQSFDVGREAAVRFNQPNAQAATLNRVTGGSRSQILGKLSANGQVYLVNGAGVLFGGSAQVNVGGLVASTLDIRNEDFLAGQDRFTLTDSSTGEVINQGSITAKNGTVALLGSTVRNQGTINTAGGNVLLAAGREVTFAAGANGHLNIAVDASELQLAVHNGGQIVLNAQGANALASAVVGNTGTLQARTVAEREGRILLLADLHHGGTAEVAGTLDASAPAQGHGGFVETSAANVRIAADTRVTSKAARGNTGTWLIAPTDFTVSADNAAQTDSGIGADTLNANLHSTSVTLQTLDGNDAGDIHVKAAVEWSANTTLTLNAHRHIHIDAAITASGDSAGLALNHGNTRGDASTTPASGSDYHIKAPVTLSGANAGLSINGNAYTLIHSMEQLDAIDGYDARNGSSVTTHGAGLGGRYALAQDLDASGITHTGALVGSEANRFTGTFAGLGHSVSHLTIDAGNADSIGLFGVTGNGSLIRDTGLIGGSVTGRNRVGGLVGDNNGGTLSQAYATGSVSGAGNVGGLVGHNGGTLSQAYATGSVSGRRNVGGLVGSNFHGAGTLSNTYWDSASTAQAQAVGDQTGAAGATDIAGSRYRHAGYTGLGTWSETAQGSGIWVARDANGTPQWVMLEGSTRPFLYSEYSTTIGNAHQLQLMALDLTADYRLARDIDARATNGQNASGMWGPAGFAPIGDEASNFTGTFDGLGHMIAGLTIARGNQDYIGLFGYSTGTLRHLGLEGGSVSGRDNVGGLVGSNDGGTLDASFYATTDAAGNSLNNGGATTGAFSGNGFGTGKTWLDLTNRATFTDAGWDLDDAGGTGKVWRIYEGHTTPLLRSFLRQITVTPGALAGKTYDGQVASGTTGYTSSGASLEGSLVYRTGSKNAGTYQTATAASFSAASGPASRATTSVTPMPS